MNGWLTPGTEPGAAERWSILLAMTHCALTTCSGEGALTARTAMIEHVDANGSGLAVRLPADGVRPDVVANPRITLVALPAPGSMALAIVTGLARMRPARAMAGDETTALLDIAIVRMEYWGDRAAATSAPAGMAVPASPRSLTTA